MLQTFKKRDLATRIKGTAFSFIFYFMRIHLKLFSSFYPETYRKMSLIESYEKMVWHISISILGFHTRYSALNSS